MANAISRTWGKAGRPAGQAIVGRSPAQRVRVQRRAARAGLEEDVRRANALAHWMDSKFTVAGVPVGLDSIIGLVPAVGDTVTAAIALYPIYLAHRHGLGTGVKARMAANVLADWAVGLVPLVGDLFDVAFKANRRNAALLEQAAAAKGRA